MLTFIMNIENDRSNCVKVRVVSFEKASAFRAEQTKLLEQVQLLDHRVELFEGSVQSGTVAVVKLLQRQRWQQQQAEKAAIAREAKGHKSPPRAITISSTTRGQAGSASPASQAGPSRPRLPSPTPGLPRATSSPVGRFVGTIPKLKKGQNTITDAQAERSRNRAKCGYRGRARSQSRTSSRSSTPHNQPYMGQHHGSAGPRDRLGNRVSHPPQQQHHSRRLGAGQPARPQGYRSQVDGHNHSLDDHHTDSTFDWDEEQLWEEEEKL